MKKYSINNIPKQLSLECKLLIFNFYLERKKELLDILLILNEKKIKTFRNLLIYLSRYQNIISFKIFTLEHQKEIISFIINNYSEKKYFEYLLNIYNLEFFHKEIKENIFNVLEEIF